MLCINWINSKIKKMDWVDIQMIKFSVFGSTLMLAKLFPVLLKLNWKWYALFSIAAAIRPMSKIFGK